MDFNYNFTSLLDTVGFIQGTTLGILLVVLNKRKNKSTFFLGLFLIFFSLKLIFFIAEDLEVASIYPDLFLMPFNFSWLLFALFFIYTQQVSFFSNKRTTYWVLIPGIFSFVVQIVIFFLPYDKKIAISQNIWHLVFFTYIGIFYSWSIAVWNLRLLYKHRIEVQNYFSMVQSKELHWARVFLIYSLVTSVIIHILYYISPDDFFYKVIFSVFDLIAIYWVSYHGVVQRNVLSLMGRKKAYESRQQDTPSQEPILSSMTKEAMEDLVNKIEEYMMTSEVFMHTELTIITIAEKLNLHPRRISKAINTICNQNFNSYVNQFRIKKAELLLKNREENYLSVEGIGNEVGFHSKSAFYSAFKKVTGTTPKKYLEQAS